MMKVKMAEAINLLPDDEINRGLLAQVHPSDWINPEPEPVYNLVVLGLGTAGLVSAIGAVGMGAKVAVVEDYLIGGDCLNFGCVPSKALIRSSRVVGEMQGASEYGINLTSPPEVDFSKVMERMRRLRLGISHHDSLERIQSLGLHVFLGKGVFRDRKSVEVDGKVLRFKKAVIATGAKPAQPPIPGLKEAGFLTNETVFSLTERPEKLVVIGGGPIGCELSQAFNRLGSEVTIVQSAEQFLPREDPDAAALLAEVFQKENIRVMLKTEVKKVDMSEDKKHIHVSHEQGEEIIEADEIMVGVGRTPNIDGLNLEAAGVDYDRGSGVKVNDYLQTTNRRIYAAGDVCFPYKFTHIADATARIVIQNALFIRSKKSKSMTIPWCTYTDPEIAHVGLYEKDLNAKGIPFDTFIRELKDVDRAILDGEVNGFIKLHVKKGKDKILGGTIVAKHAGEMISELTLAMVSGKGLRTLNNVIHPYPTQAEALRQAASQYYMNKFSLSLKKWLTRWFRWRR